MTTPHSTRPEPGQSGYPDQPGTGAAMDAGPPVAAQPGQPREPGTGYSADELERRDFGGDLARGAWPAFMAAAFGSLAVGILLLAWPKGTLTVVAVLIGVALLVAGVLRLMDGFTAHDASGGKRVASVVIGLLAIVLGLYCIRHYHVTIAALAIIVGLFWVIHGIADISVGLFGGSFPGRGLTVLTGVLSLCAGLIVLFWPTISLTVLIAVIGIWLVIYGLLLGFMALRMRRIGSHAPAPGQLTAA
jgi:uncharacterized membrane protein HdeD (DUF308 family)